jgi:hypothetical protein
MKDESSVPAAQKMTDLFLPILPFEFRKGRIQMIDDTPDFRLNETTRAVA